MEYPDARLTTPCDPVDLGELDALQGFIDDLIYTMFSSGGVGLAAPQVGRNLRIFTIDQQPVNGRGDVDPWVFVNPEVEVLGDEVRRRKEGCLSFPGVFIHANRPKWVKVSAFDRHGEKFTLDATGADLLSLAVQHENDHLDGILMSRYADRRGAKAIKNWAASR